MPPDSTSRFQIRCDTGLHRVAIDPARYWHPIKCPSCRTRIDRRRFRRARQWLVGKAPRSAVRFGDRLRIVPLEGLALFHVALLSVVTLLLHTVADSWWPATLLLFLGRWPWLVIGLPLLLLAVVLRHRRTMVLMFASVVLGLFGIMELSLGLGRFANSDSATSDPVRVISFNTAGNAPAPMRLVALVTEWQPDVLAIQECGALLHDALRGLPGYSSDVGATCLLTRFPIVRIDSLGRDNFMAAGGAAWVKRYRLRAPDGEFDVTNLHLDTPRKAFESLIRADDGATQVITDKTDVRELESRLARRWVDLGAGPRLVAGDFNMPTESAIFRRHWASFTDGFERAGFGFGYTRYAGWIRLRIDHVLADEGWVVRAARVLPDYGSDHRPVMVDLERRDR
ncbi:MAG TPA: endonuclease/exonuclease/phosphatase family protein [Gemmatimonadaceae bacterium]|nr:endonuclease/exonuclease/phosphatase family protein [Gemmatimonadaceae bacterium]